MKSRLFDQHGRNLNWSFHLSQVRTTFGYKSERCIGSSETFFIAPSYFIGNFFFRHSNRINTQCMWIHVQHTTSRKSAYCSICLCWPYDSCCPPITPDVLRVRDTGMPKQMAVLLPFVLVVVAPLDTTSICGSRNCQYPLVPVPESDTSAHGCVDHDTLRG